MHLSHQGQASLNAGDNFDARYLENGVYVDAIAAPLRQHPLRAQEGCSGGHAAWFT